VGLPFLTAKTQFRLIAARRLHPVRIERAFRLTIAKVNAVC
jgi:hypothetical protein